MARARTTEFLPVRVGLAGWSESASRYAKLLPHPAEEGATGLQRYATAFDFVEINSSFYRQIRPATYEKWSEDVPDGFRFAVKMHRLLTHYTRLKNTALLQDFFGSVSGLGDKLAVVLVQLPPTLIFDRQIVVPFFEALRRRCQQCVVCEPRHASWFTSEVRDLLASYAVGLVLTEIPAEGEAPAMHASPTIPLYVRLHGAPRKYYSSYGSGDLRRLADFLAGHGQCPRYVVFDNTAGPSGVRNGLELLELVR